jgi:hypothetical protein
MQCDVSTSGHGSSVMLSNDCALLLLKVKLTYTLERTAWFLSGGCFCVVFQELLLLERIGRCVKDG